MTWSKFSFKVIIIKCGSHISSLFYSISIEELKMHPEASIIEQKIILGQTWCFGANDAIKIPIRAYF